MMSLIRWLPFYQRPSEHMEIMISQTLPEFHSYSHAYALLSMTVVVCTSSLPSWELGLCFSVTVYSFYGSKGMKEAKSHWGWCKFVNSHLSSFILYSFLSSFTQIVWCDCVKQQTDVPKAQYYCSCRISSVCCRGFGISFLHGIII